MYWILPIEVLMVKAVLRTDLLTEFLVLCFHGFLLISFLPAKHHFVIAWGLADVKGTIFIGL